MATHPIVEYTSPSSWALVRAAHAANNQERELTQRAVHAVDRGQALAVREGDPRETHRLPRGT